jgi:hypothetical protein
LKAILELDQNLALEAGRREKPHQLLGATLATQRLVVATNGRWTSGQFKAVCLTAYNALPLGEGEQPLVI